MKNKLSITIEEIIGITTYTDLKEDSLHLVMETKMSHIDMEPFPIAITFSGSRVAVTGGKLFNASIRTDVRKYMSGESDDVSFGHDADKIIREILGMWMNN